MKAIILLVFLSMNAFADEKLHKCIDEVSALYQKNASHILPNVAREFATEFCTCTSKIDKTLPETEMKKQAQSCHSKRIGPKEDEAVKTKFFQTCFEAASAPAGNIMKTRRPDLSTAQTTELGQMYGSAYCTCLLQHSGNQEMRKFLSATDYPAVNKVCVETATHTMNIMATDSLPSEYIRSFFKVCRENMATLLREQLSGKVPADALPNILFTAPKAYCDCTQEDATKAVLTGLPADKKLSYDQRKALSEKYTTYRNSEQGIADEGKCQQKAMAVTDELIKEYKSRPKI